MALTFSHLMSLDEIITTRAPLAIAPSLEIEMPSHFLKHITKPEIGWHHAIFLRCNMIFSAIYALFLLPILTVISHDAFDCRLLAPALVSIDSAMSAYRFQIYRAQYYDMPPLSP